MSALQKGVRRGNIEGVVYWLVELDRSGFGNWGWKRLKIMVSEDIGMASPLLPLRVEELYKQWKSERRANRAKAETEAIRACGNPGTKAPPVEETERRLLLSMGRYLCRCPKSRELNDALTVASQHCDRADIFPAKEGNLDVMPEFRGVSDDVVRHLVEQLVWQIQKGSLEHCAWLIRWLYIASRGRKEKESTVDLEIAARLDYIWDALERVADVIPRTTLTLDCVRVLRHWHRIDGGSVLWLLHATALLCRYPWLQSPAKHFPSAAPVTLMNPMEVQKLYDDQNRMPIPDHALDKHTSRGKALGRGIEHFFDVGCYLKGEVGENPFQPRARAYYTELAANRGAQAPKSTRIRKRIRERGTVPQGLQPVKKRPKTEDPPPPLEGVSLPTIRFRGETFQTKRPLNKYPKNAVLAQLPTGHKPMSRLGQMRLKRGSPLQGAFVKGPLTKKQAETQIRLDQAKDELPFMQRVGTALWKGPEGWFVIMRDLGGGPYPYLSEERETNHYGKQQVAVDRGKCINASKYLDGYGSKTWPEPTDDFMKQYMAVLFFRKTFGISDTNNRNIVVVGDAVYSVDETVMLQKLEQPSLFGRSINKFVRRWVGEWIDPKGPHRDYVKKLLQGWLRVAEVQSKKPDSIFAVADNAPRKQLVRLANWWSRGELRVQPQTSGERTLAQVAARTKPGKLIDLT